MHIKNINNNKQPRFFVMCFPHLGSLDNWLPIVYKMSSLLIEKKLTLIIPDANTVRSFHKDNSVVSISNNLFDSVLLHAYDDVWIEHKLVFDAMKWHKNNRIFLRLFNILNRVIKRRLFYYFFNWIILLLKNMLYAKELKINIQDLGRYVSNVDIMFYDIHTECNQNYMVLDMLKLFKNNKKYSLPHQLDLLTFEGRHPKLFNIANKNNIKIFMYAEFQNKFYNARYGIDENKMHIVGIPRHDRGWIKIIQKEGGRLPKNFNDDNTIVVLSLQVSNAGLSFEQKTKAIENIKKIFIDKLNMKVAIKLHPTESKEKIFLSRNNKIYEDILGLDNYGITWIYSNLHVFSLAKNKRLAISLGTAVSFDMVSMNTPCIEYVDSSAISNNMEKYERKLSQIVNYGFIEGVSNYKQLYNYVDNWIVSNNQAQTISTNVYKKYFPKFDDVLTRITTEILN